MTNETAILDRYAVIGYPVSHSRSPIIHQQFADQTQQALSYELLETHPNDLEKKIRGFQRAGGKGLNVTAPHKTSVTRLVDEMSESASIAGAVNTLKFDEDRVVGFNTDGIGLVRDLRDNWDFEIPGSRILILGAGGATQGIVGPLLELEPSSIVIANRTVTKADALANHFGALGNVEGMRFNDVRSVEPFDLLINATSADLSGESAPFPRDAVARGKTACYDLSYALHKTPFVTWAQQVDAGRTRAGWGMLIEQAAESFRIWRGVMPETGPVLNRLPASN